MDSFFAEVEIEVEKEENLQLPKEEPKNKLTAATHPVEKKVLAELFICATCGELGQPVCIFFTAMKIILKMTKKVFSGVPESVLTQLLIQFFPNLVFSH